MYLIKKIIQIHGSVDVFYRPRCVMDVMGSWDPKPLNSEKAL